MNSSIINGQWSWLKRARPGPRGEPLTINNRLIDALFDYIIGIMYEPLSKKSPTTQNFRTTFSSTRHDLGQHFFCARAIVSCLRSAHARGFVRGAWERAIHPYFPSDGSFSGTFQSSTGIDLATAAAMLNFTNTGKLTFPHVLFQALEFDGPHVYFCPTSLQRRFPNLTNNEQQSKIPATDSCFCFPIAFRRFRDIFFDINILQPKAFPI